MCKCIEEVKKMREDYNHRLYLSVFPNPIRDKDKNESDIIDVIIERLEKLPKEDTFEDIIMRIVDPWGE